MADLQTPMLLNLMPWPSESSEKPPALGCHQVWDSTTASFAPCFIPYLSNFPTILGLLIVLIKYAFKYLSAIQPKWTKPLVEESKEHVRETDTCENKRPLTATLALLTLTLMGLTFQILSAFFPEWSEVQFRPAYAWAIVLAIILIDRPSTASFSLFALSSMLLFTQVVTLSHVPNSYTAKHILMFFAPIAALSNIAIILNMPMRDPMLPNKDISPVFSIPTIELRTPEDNLTPWQYMTVSWMAPLIRKGATKDLEEEDVWDLGFEFKHERLYNAFKRLQGSVTKRIFLANGIDLLRSTCLSLLQLAATLLIPLVLQRILASINDPLAPRSATVTYAFISLALRLLSAQSKVFNLWYQRRAFERCRGEMMVMLYEKTLKRKIQGAKPLELEKQATMSATRNSNDDMTTSGATRIAHTNSANKLIKTTLKERLKNTYHYLLYLLSGGSSRDLRIKTDATATKGAASMGKILNLMRGDVYNVAQRFWDFSDFTVKPVGAIFSILLIWQMLGWSCLIGVLALAVSQLINIAIARLQVYVEVRCKLATDEKLQRVTQFIESIRHLRWYGWQETWIQGIMETRQKELHLRIASAFTTTSLAFILKMGSGLFPAVAFWAFTTLAGKPLRVDVIFPAFDLFNLLESHLGALPELLTTILNAYVAMGRIETFMSEPNKEEVNIVLESCAQFNLHNVSFAWPGIETNVLENLTLSFPPGLTVVYGEVATGKTALLQALLGELDQTAGDFVRPDEVMGYCAQTPWLQSMSIRENIIFSHQYQEERYQKVLDACALIPDMMELKDGDMSNIGENGIGLSGGQKARVALARAVYSHAKILLLDDPLSALDHQTAETIVRRLINGRLLEGRTTILVTHRTDLCHGLAKQWVRLDRGCAVLHEPSRADGMSLLRRTQSDSSATEEERKDQKKESRATPAKFMEDEHRARGGVKSRVYWRYIRAGTLYWWSLAIVVMALYHLINFAQTWLIKAWSESYDHGRPEGLFDFLPPAADNVVPWLRVFFAILVVTAILYWGTTLVMFGVGYQAGKFMFTETLQRIAHANFRFYDVTPVGRLMNRLTNDMSTIDGNLSHMFTLFAWQAIGWVTSIMMIMSVAPVFLLFGILLCSSFVFCFFRFLPTSQSLRRLEMVSLSPLMSNFGALVEGLTTVRAFKAQKRFLNNVIGVIDKFQKNDHFYWCLRSWLEIRFTVMSACATLIMTLIAVYTGLSAGLTAFFLIAASSFVSRTEYICRIYGMLELDFASVERIVELLDIETEPPGIVNPPAYWPTYSGNIEFEDVTIRYAQHLDPALQNITLQIPAGSNTAVIGRTGSGKSTLAVSLLAAIVAEKGRILIDGVDISTVNKQALRRRVTFLAQEPVLFSGSMRKNLDPLNEYSDAACESVLAKIAGTHHWTLLTSIEGGGKGLSQGQRQLVGLARAMLRQSPVLIMDEATASIDFETAQRIQTVLREEMRHSTVITIAHRLEAVKNADYCVVLGKGKLIKAGKASEMLREGSEFSSMLA